MVKWILVTPEKSINLDAATRVKLVGEDSILVEFPGAEKAEFCGSIAETIAMHAGLKMPISYRKKKMRRRRSK